MNAIAQASAGPVSGSKLDNRRVLSGLIDVAIVAVGGAVILAAAGVLGQSPSEFGGGLSLVILGWGLYYYFALESGNGQTVGKRVMNLRVVRTDGSAAGMREIGIRTVLRVVDGLFLYLVGLVVMMVTGERRGRLGDLAGETMIVSADVPAAPTAAPAADEPASRVPIAESGPAFAPAVVEEPVEADEPVEAPEAIEAPEPVDEPVEPEVSSPALQSLAADVSAVTSDPERAIVEAEEEPVAEAGEGDEPETVRVEAEAAEEVEAVEDQDVEAEADDIADESADDESAEDEDREVSVRTVQTVSAMDVVMGDDERA